MHTGSRPSNIRILAWWRACVLGMKACRRLCATTHCRWRRSAPWQSRLVEAGAAPAAPAAPALAVLALAAALGGLVARQCSGGTAQWQ